MVTSWRIATIYLILVSLVTGGIYPLTITAIAQWAFPYEANGSLILQGERVVGSELLGQAFSRPEYFWGRLSATAQRPYNAMASSGSNYGPLHPALCEAARVRIEALRTNGTAHEQLPVDLVTSSASGLDPHISRAAADVQIERIARARKLEASTVRELVDRSVEGRQWGIFGEPRVHVLRLNLALDQLSSQPQ